MGLSSVSAESQAGILFTRELVLCSPPVFRKKILKALANEVVLAAEVDSFKDNDNGNDGSKFRENIENHWRNFRIYHRALFVSDEKKLARRD
jgi:RNA processing factor Prp31